MVILLRLCCRVAACSTFFAPKRSCTRRELLVSGELIRATCRRNVWSATDFDLSVENLLGLSGLCPADVISRTTVCAGGSRTVIEGGRALLSTWTDGAAWSDLGSSPTN